MFHNQKSSQAEIKANFIAEYEDGSTERFGANHERVSRGGHIATLVALELQDEGRLKPGNIVRTYPLA
jgi:hypothetical protein